MAEVSKSKTHVRVELSAKEVRDAIEHAAWCAAVDDDASIAIAGGTLVVRHKNGSYRVRYTKGH